MIDYSFNSTSSVLVLGELCSVMLPVCWQTILADNNDEVDGDDKYYFTINTAINKEV